MVVKNLPDQEQEAISEQEKRDQEAREQATGNMDISVMRMYRFETDRPLKAFVDITINDVLLIKQIIKNL